MDPAASPGQVEVLCSPDGPPGVDTADCENQVGLGWALPCNASFDQDGAGVGLIFCQVPQIPF